MIGMSVFQCEFSNDAGDNVQPVGRMELNSINDVAKIAGEKITRRNNPSLADLEEDLDDEAVDGKLQRFYNAFLYFFLWSIGLLFLFRNTAL